MCVSHHPIVITVGERGGGINEAACEICAASSLGELPSLTGAACGLYTAPCQHRGYPPTSHVSCRLHPCVPCSWCCHSGPSLPLVPFPTSVVSSQPLPSSLQPSLLVPIWHSRAGIVAGDMAALWAVMNVEVGCQQL